MAEAALSDMEETRAAKSLRANLGMGMGMGMGRGGTRENDLLQTQNLQSRVSINVSQLLYGGRTDRLADTPHQCAADKHRPAV